MVHVPTQLALVLHALSVIFLQICARNVLLGSGSSKTHGLASTQAVRSNTVRIATARAPKFATLAKVATYFTITNVVVPHVRLASVLTWRQDCVSTPSVRLKIARIALPVAS